METFDYRGHPIRYVHEGKGEPIVFIHNGGTSHTIWRDIVPRFSDRYEIFSIDLLGFGSSAKPDSGYRLADYVAFIEAFVDAHKLSSTRFVGNCMGSAMALGFAMKHPTAVRSLVLVNPLTDATFASGWLGSALWLRKNAPAVSHGLQDALGRMRLPNIIGEQSLAFQFGPIGRKKKLQYTPELCACFAGESQMHSLLSVFDDLEAYASLDRFEPGPDFPPICTIWGVENRVLSANAGRKLNQTLHPVREEWLEGCGHLPMMEKPEEVATIIDEFFGETWKAAVA